MSDPGAKHARAKQVLLVLLGLSGLALGGDRPSCRETPGQRGAGPLEQSAYVWQRGWGSLDRSVEVALAQHGSTFAELLVLAAEIDPERGDVEVAWDARSLAETGARVGLVVRVGPWSFDGTTRVRERMIAAALAQLDRADAAGLEVAELQIDFDAASRSLADYAEWLVELRRALRTRGFARREVALTITALPDWLSRPELAELLEVVDGWVLQVHSLSPPRESGSRELIDPAKARAAVERAAALGRPFRVALPTYDYLIARSGSLASTGGLAAEQAPANPSRERFDRASVDPAEVAELVAGWTEDRPAALTGVVWFRLPTAADRLAWSWPTLRAVMAGRAPLEELALEICTSDAGLSELALINRGEADAWTSELAPLHVRADRPWLAHDALAWFEADAREDTLVLEASSHRRIAPGESLAIAWIRFEGPAELDVDFPTTPCTSDPTRDSKDDA